MSRIMSFYPVVGDGGRPSGRRVQAAAFPPDFGRLPNRPGRQRESRLRMTTTGRFAGPGRGQDRVGEEGVVYSWPQFPGISGDYPINPVSMPNRGYGPQ